MTRKEQADSILYDDGLLAELRKYGVPHIIGSYRMDMMAWNDLDIDVENDNMSQEKLYGLSEFIFHRFRPSWYEAKEEQNQENKKVWFHGFETLVEGELWNIDIWFFDKETIGKAEEYCDGIMRRAHTEPDLKNSIMDLKKELIARGMYSFEQYTSMDVYEAVLRQRIRNIEEFLEKYHRR